MSSFFCMMVPFMVLVSSPKATDDEGGKIQKEVPEAAAPPVDIDDPSEDEKIYFSKARYGCVVQVSCKTKNESMSLCANAICSRVYFWKG